MQRDGLVGRAGSESDVPLVDASKVVAEVEVVVADTVVLDTVVLDTVVVVVDCVVVVGCSVLVVVASVDASPVLVLVLVVDDTIAPSAALPSPPVWPPLGRAESQTRFDGSLQKSTPTVAVFLSAA